LGNLRAVIHLELDRNALDGSLPGQLGSLSLLEQLILDNNDLTGPVPPEFGRMSSLRRLSLGNNVAMEGPLPSELAALGRLEVLMAGGTSLCAPRDAAFQSWLSRVPTRRVSECGAAGSMAYLTQAVQSREFPVPLVAGERALLRVFVTARRATSEGLPPVLARFYLGGMERHVAHIPSQSSPIPTEVNQGNLSYSANAEIPGQLVQPGLQMVIEVDPDGTLDPGLGVTRRIPEAGRLEVDVRAMPPFDLTLIPFIPSQRQDASIVGLIQDVAADPQNHDLLWNTRTLMPIGDLNVRAHEPVVTTSNTAAELLSATTAIRAIEGGTGHYMGMMSDISGSVTGLARRPGRVSFSIPWPFTIAHELGHNLSLRHAPCGAIDADPSFPYPDGSIGAWGYDFRSGGGPVHPSARDQMSYCGPPWISDYHFTNALSYRLVDEGTPTAAAGVGTKSLLLWGGISTDSAPFLEPTFVVDAPAALPDSAGEHRLTGRTDSGGELFSMSFAMPETADSDGSSSFAFVLPVRPDWENSLASISLTGPGGSATLDAESNLPMAILRNPLNGQVRGILRVLPAAMQATADARASGTPGLEVMFSQGIPTRDAWRR